MKPKSPNRLDSNPPKYTFGNFRLEPDGTLFRGETAIHLPPKELAALRLLLNHAGQVVTRTQLKQDLWGDINVTADSVPRCMSSLRARLEPDQCIQTVYKRGYRLAGQVSRQGLPDGEPVRLAVIPFAAGQHVASYLPPAIAEEVTARLTELNAPEISLLARDSVFTLSRQGMSAIEVGEALQADLALTGTLLATPTHFRLRAEMIRVEDGTQIWVEDILVPRHQVADLTVEMTRRLILRIGGDFSASLETATTGPGAYVTRPDAYDTFLRGHQEWQTFERHSMKDGMQRLIEATELDPSFIAAQIDLANVCVTQELFGFMPPGTAAEQIRRIRRAVPEIARTAPGLLPTLGWVSFHMDRDLPAALEMFSLSAHLPHDPSTTRLRVMFALSRHRFGEAGEWLEAALVADPFAPWLHARRAWTWHLAGDANRSVDQIRRALRQFPEHGSTRLTGAAILAFNGHGEEAAKLAAEVVRRTPYYDIATATYAYSLACAGQHDEARSVLENLEWLSRERFVLTSFTAAAYAALGDLPAAIAQLRAGSDAHCPWFFQMLADPRLKPLHTHPEFQRMRALLERMESTLDDGLE
jgi:DNA-binding winged helix-turn-helix (wHTH) protein